MSAVLPDDERLQELLALRAVEGLAEHEQRELEHFSTRYPQLDTDALERVAASLALVGLEREPMPAALRARVEADAAAWLSQRNSAPEGTGKASAQRVVELRPRPAPATAWGGWLAAAATLVLAVVGWLQVDRTAQEREALAARQAALESAVSRLERSLAEKDAALDALQEPTAGELLAALEGRPGTRVLPWSATEDPAAAEAGGAVVWNGEAQAGVMRFSGLQPNDPAEWQYQLWIFDAARDERFPVDGGVFDVGPDGEALVPIRASLPVGEAVLFAITVERPGGVVVSSRERIALVAQPGA
ncbi:anti-sigma factor domain-containing protein [Thioalkalivibrio sp. XN279]|uniref:anti-sigma factor domain-containing protein n=1 Tax=Thioalkalivibrio sp. XN279 TaxID=2714953 RepID=UPI00140DB8CD|nr:anti-sigma factor [Thioalkalivibrio sp. XN279]NHA14247.1 hypothetical protein [Thioalkalivibrio sp. XN279]